MLDASGEKSVSAEKTVPGGIERLSIDLERDVFLRTLVRELAGALQDIVGLQEAAGFISIVGQRMGDSINREYTRKIGHDSLTRDEVAAVLVDLKRRIQGDFYIISETPERVVMGNRRCPFGEKVIGRPALCMMTSNVFGAITAQNLGYAKVELQHTIAAGDPECRVIVHLVASERSAEVEGREYFASV